MIKIFTSFFLLVQVQLLAGGQDDQILASAGSHQILFSQFTERYTDYLLATGLRDNITVRQAILNNMVNEILLQYFDDNSKIYDDPAYVKETTWKQKQVVLAFLKDQEIHSKITVSDEELRETFIRVNETISASHLYTPSEEEANQIYGMLQIGVDWDNLAAQLFADSTLRANGGYLGYFTWGDMDPAFEDAAFKLKPGEYSKPVKTAYGYSIIRVEDRKPHPLLTEWQYTIKKPKLTAILKLRKKKAAERDYVKNIFDKSGISFDEEALNNLFSYFSFSFGMNEKPEQFVDRNAVTFYGKEYTTSELIKMIDEIPEYQKEKITGAESFRTVISGLLLQHYLLNKAVESGYDTISYVKARIEAEKLQVFLNYKQREILDKIPVTTDEMHHFYSENIRYFATSPEWEMQEIVVSSLSLADSIKYLILQGEDMGKLAGKYSERRWSADNNGSTGYIPESDLGILKGAVEKAQPGELIGPVRLEDKFGLFRITGKKDGEIKPYDQVEDIVMQGVKFEKRGSALMDYINKIHNSVNVYINQDLLTNKQIAGLN